MGRHPTLDEIEGGESSDSFSQQDTIDDLRAELASLRAELLDAHDQIAELRHELSEVAE